MSRKQQTGPHQTGEAKESSSSKSVTIAVIAALGAVLAAVGPTVISHVFSESKQPVQKPTQQQQTLASNPPPINPQPTVNRVSTDAAENKRQLAKQAVDSERGLVKKYALAGETEEAIKGLQKIAQLQPRDAAIHECLAHAYLSGQHDFDAANDEYKRAIPLPNSTPHMAECMNIINSNKELIFRLWRYDGGPCFQLHLDLARSSLADANCGLDIIQYEGVRARLRLHARRSNGKGDG